VQPFSYAGSSYGYACGGYAGGMVATIDKTSFTSDGNSTDAGDLAISVYHIRIRGNIPTSYPSICTI
jgi:hypothetical protein